MARTPGKDNDLKQLLRSAGFTYQTVDRKYVQLLFGSPWRSWVVGATLNEQWLSLSTYVCAIPESPCTKAALLDLLMRLNDEACLVKYSCRGEAINLELQYRESHLEAEVVDGLMGYSSLARTGTIRASCGSLAATACSSDWESSSRTIRAAHTNARRPTSRSYKAGLEAHAIGDVP
jgi:hypothetical protein